KRCQEERRGPGPPASFPKSEQSRQQREQLQTVPPRGKTGPSSFRVRIDRQRWPTLQYRRADHKRRRQYCAQPPSRQQNNECEQRQPSYLGHNQEWICASFSRPARSAGEKEIGADPDGRRKDTTRQCLRPAV